MGGLLAAIPAFLALFEYALVPEGMFDLFPENCRHGFQARLNKFLHLIRRHGFMAVAAREKDGEQVIQYLIDCFATG
jgi:hypothetical protein